MAITFKKATRTQSKLRLALTGPSGSGKSWGALILAKGMGGKTAVIDTERGSASLYSDLTEFDVLDLQAPYTPERFIEAINGTGYGLTLGIHTRIDDTAEYIASRVRVGNCYVNRNQIGAVVGVQPFGGEGLSGTGPKAGGPHYLLRFATERTLTVNTTAAGGNASLLTLGE